MGEGRGPVEILITNYSCVPCGRCVCTPVASRSARLSPCDLSRVRKLPSHHTRGLTPLNAISNTL